jgi:hypothetical protein
MILRSFLLLILLTGCGRQLTPSEAEFARSLQGDQLDLDRVRLVRGAPVGSVTFRRKARPRVTCRERLLPPVTEAIVTTSPAAVTLFNKIYFARDWYVDDYLPDYPEKLVLVRAMLLAHEITHVWQWQNRDRTGYSPLRAASEQAVTDDPYLFDLQDARDFLSYGFEQQASIVEEYICCRALAPDAARTQRLHDMLQGAFPVRDLPDGGAGESDVYLPWDGAETGGICA